MGQTTLSFPYVLHKIPGIYPGPKVVQHIVESKKCTIDIQEVPGTPAGIHFTHFLVRCEAPAEIGDPPPEFRGSEIEVLLVEGSGKDAEHFAEEVPEEHTLVWRIQGS